MGDSPHLSRDRAELHSHTTCSDGLLSPEQLVAEAEAIGLAALAVTDHDTVAGIAAARAAAQMLPLELIGGIEFSSNIGEREVHILGLFIGEDSTQLVEATRQARRFRRQRAEEIVGKLNDLGLALQFSVVEAIAGGGSIGRPHIGAAMVEKGLVATLDEAFRRYLGISCPAFAPKPTLPATVVIDVLHSAGGVTILAHPGSSRVPDSQILELVEMELDGLETHHPKHRPQQEARFAALAEAMEVLPSRGSDFHGPRGYRTPLGAYAASLDCMEALRRKAAEYQHDSSPEEST